MREINKNLWTQAEFAKVSGKSRQRINQLIKSGDIDVLEINGATLVKKSKPKDRYHYKGEDSIDVVVIKFYDSPDFILHKDVYLTSGSLGGLVRSGKFELDEIEGFHMGKMKESEFFNLPTWEG